MAAKRVIILETRNVSPLLIDYVLWAAVPSVLQPFYAAAQKDFVSAWTGISAEDLAEFQAGAMTEHRDLTTFSKTVTQPGADKILADIWQQFQSATDASAKWASYGTYLDDSGQWTRAGVKNG